MSDFEVGDSYYDVLDVSRSASESEIQKAWVKQTKEVHADKTGEDDKYEYLLDAGAVLKDEEARKAYDALGHELFVDRYGRRGSKKDIDPEDKDPETANTPDPSSTTTDSETSSSTGTDGSANSTSSTTTSSTSTTGGGSTAGSSTSTSGNTSTATGNTGSRGGSSRTSTGSQRSSTNTGQNTGGGRNNGRTRTQTKTTTGGRHQTTGTDSTSSESDGGGVFDRFRQKFGSAMPQSIVGIPIGLLVMFPVSSRLLAVFASLFTASMVAGEFGQQGTGLDLLGAIAFVGVLLLGIRWLPDYLGAAYPRESTYLSKLPTLGVAGLMWAGITLVYLSELSVSDTVMVAGSSSGYLLGAILGAIIFFLIIGGILGIVGVVGGGAAKETFGAVLFWSGVLGGIVAFFMLGTTFGNPREEIMSEVAEIGQHPWPFVEALPEVILHGPMIAMLLFSVTVTVALFIGIPLATLVLFHHPQRHAHQGWFVRPSAWEFSIATLFTAFVWGFQYESPAAAPALEPYLGGLLITDSGLVELIWVPAAVLVTLFAVKELIEPAYSEWRE